MIKEISSKITKKYGKKNWIDQNNVVFGYEDNQKCCEYFGWGVYDPITGKKVADEIHGLPYHFMFGEGAVEVTGGTYANVSVGNFEVIEAVQITLEHDDDKSKHLVFECFCRHNGYYYHSFDFVPLESDTSLIKEQSPIPME